MPIKINVHKPEFNLREKLNRLDTERVPYEKMLTIELVVLTMNLKQHRAPFNNHPF